ncbi:hypothetical protein OJAV_G00004490 [Oryzias javanicus]|uniref:Uncharacterized protein n=1 Tax=Oryzias javanicus TaxID=123683 RepID=A0A3S2PTQ5_ORYJA|nr:hypothetical protein OJAV_G00004490 [Oryzias javanicus]
MELEKMRRAEQLMLQRNPAGKKEEKKSAAPAPIRNHQQRLENIVKQTTVESRPEVDFFGRAVAPNLRDRSLHQTQVRGVRFSPWEQLWATATCGSASMGMSNAVRRNVYIRELL